MSPTAIEWTEETWNPVVGCSKVSPGCAHCYAEQVHKTRLSGQHGYPEFRPWTPANAAHNVRLMPHRLRDPFRWRKPRMVFVNSMSDLFHEQVPDDYIARVFDAMRLAPQHTFQVLTKRPERMAELVPELYDYLSYDILEYDEEFLPNVWLGVSIENRRFAHRVDPLLDTPAAVRFISAEPLLGPLADDVDLAGIDWLIVGGESGPNARPIRPEWARDLRDAAAEHGTAFFFKQWGGRTAKAGGRELDGRTWDELPKGGAS